MITKYVLNNKVTEQEFEKIVFKWLSEGDYTPDDIIENIITEKNLLLVPLYFIRAEYSGSCSVSIGHLEEQCYEEYDKDKGYRVTRSRWITRWQAFSQDIQDKVATTIYAGSPIAAEIENFVESMGWQGEDLQEISTGSNHYQDISNLFKITKEQSWSNKGGKKSYNDAYSQTIPKLPSSIYDNLYLNINFHETSSIAVAAPYWLFRYEYNGQNYFVVVDGYSPERIKGTKPEDSKRKDKVDNIYLFGWFLGLLGTLLVLYCFAGLSFSNISFSWKYIGITAICLFITAFSVYYKVFSVKYESKVQRDKKLANKLSKL